MSDLPIEKRFGILCQISRAQHFAWRQAVQEMCPDLDPEDAVNRMWEIVGKQTGDSYAKHLKADQPLAMQIASSVAWSSQCMGEDAVVEPGADGSEAFVRHSACPWLDWHKKLGLEKEDQPGCDRWFEFSVNAINNKSGCDLRWETLESLPAGDSSCLRRFWVEKSSDNPDNA